jgi:hypothetical protein
VVDPKSPPPSPGDGSRSPAATITFPCPNGHRISVPAKLAGKRGACSKCGTAVVIPPTSVAITAPSAPSAGRPAVPQTDAFAAGGDDPQGGEDGTITLKSPPVWPPTLAAVAPVANASPDGATVPPINSGPASTPLVHAGPAARGGGGPQEGPGGAGAGGDPAANALVANPTALLVARLWAERDHGGIVELHLVGGSVILPEWYEPAWSQGSHGLFASQAADGSVTLTAVSWDSIQKVVVRQVEGLPDGMFE